MAAIEESRTRVMWRTARDRIAHAMPSMRGRRGWRPAIVAVVALVGVYALVRAALGIVTAPRTHERESAGSVDPKPTATRSIPGDDPTGGKVTRTSMRHVDFHVDSDVVLHVRHLRGVMRSKAGGPVVFDDKHSFIIRIDTADVGLTGPDLSTLLNRYVFAYKGAPLSHLKVTIANGELVQTGRLHKGVTVHFEMHATVSLTPDGRIRLHPTKTKILGLNGQALMKAFGLSMEKLIDLRGARGATLEKNDILLDPDSILPPPTIEGRIVSIRVDGDQLVQTFGSAAGDSAEGGRVAKSGELTVPDPDAPNYMFYRGGTLRFGKLLMLDADMMIVDLDPDDPFDFDLDRYNAQLVAGYSRTLSDLGLEVYMKDISDVRTKGGRGAADRATPRLP